jgi:hypothetical protein
MPKTPTPTHTFTAAALKAEQGRRKNNKTRPKGEKAKAKSFIFPAMNGDQIEAVLAGSVVELTFKSGRVELVGLKG